MILIVDDEKNIRSSLAGLLEDDGYKTMAVESAEKAEKILAGGEIDLILLDIQMPGKDGLTFLDDNQSRLGDIPVVVISGRGDIPTAVAALKLGAYDYIEKPLLPERVLLTVQQALRLSKSLRTEHKLVGQILDRYRIIGQSDAIVRLWRQIEKAAAGDSTILITGENGTGKELVARHIHYLSARKSEPMVTVNCPAISEHLFESELFGHVKGAFTGAQGDRAGRCEKADGGTLFFDEIGDLPSGMQPKLLRFLESGEYEKVGDATTHRVDCRTLAATNRNLKEMITEKSFREDLYFRLNVIELAVPPLRERPEDIPLLVDYFRDKYSVGNEFIFDSDALGILATFDWPGNVRQLANLVQHIAFACESGRITDTDIHNLYHRDDISLTIPVHAGENKLSAAIRNFETGYLSHLYQKHAGNIAAMARELDMDRGNLSRKLKSLGIV